MTLDRRKSRILQAVINEYVETAEPVGSEWLVTRYDFGCKSATLRNEMAEMADLGYLMQPHTSAGRVPSNRGYRYYVDCLMTPAPFETTGNPSALSDEDLTRREIEEVVQLTCRLLADMTQYPSVATPPAYNATMLHRIYLSCASPQHALAVLLLSTGHVEHRFIPLSGSVGDSALQRVTNYMNEVLAGRELSELGRSALPVIPAELQQERALISQVYSCVVDAARSLDDERLFVEGTNHILRQREFQDVMRLEHLLTALEKRSVLWQVFENSPVSQDVMVMVGPENTDEVMQECSVVTSRYWIRERTGGYIGVVGPTRMHYDRAVAAVGQMARSLTYVLTRASLG